MINHQQKVGLNYDPMKNEQLSTGLIYCLIIIYKFKYSKSTSSSAKGSEHITTMKKELTSAKVATFLEHDRGLPH